MIVRKHVMKNVFVIIIYRHTVFISKNISSTDLQIFPPSRGTTGTMLIIASNALASANLECPAILNITYKHKLAAGPAKNKTSLLINPMFSRSALRLKPNGVILTLSNFMFKIKAAIKCAASWTARAIIISITYHSFISNSLEGFIDSPFSQTSIWSSIFSVFRVPMISPPEILSPSSTKASAIFP